MTAEEIYALMWECFEPFERGLKDPERKVALDSCIDAASRKLAVSIETKKHRISLYHECPHHVAWQLCEICTQEEQ